MTQASYTRQLAAFVHRSRWEDLPQHVRHEAKRSILNFFGTALGGCSDRAATTAYDVLAKLAGPSVATVIGRSERIDILNSAFLNALSGNAFDFDDTHPRTIIHPTAPVAPAVFALAEDRPLSGADLLHAFVLGVEVECRLGNAVSPGHYRRGWHITSTCGVFGAAAASGKCLGLNEDKIVWALGNASAQSSGLVETLGSMSKSIGVGNAARNGLLSALMAEQGFAGPDLPIEGPRGFAHVMGDAPDLAALVDGLGEHWEISDNTYKPYPCGVVLNSVIDACLELRSDARFALDCIQSITVEGHPLLLERTDRPHVSTGRESQVSAQHAVAVTLIYGEAGVEQFSDAAVASPDVLRLRAKVRMKESAEYPVGAARVIVDSTDGEQIGVRIDEPRGSSGRPLTDGEIEAKVRKLAAFGAPAIDPGPLIEAIWTLDTVENAALCLQHARP